MVSFYPVSKQDALSHKPAINGLTEWYSSNQPEELERMLSIPCTIRLRFEELAFIDVMSRNKGISRGKFISMLTETALMDLVMSIPDDSREDLIEKSFERHKEILQQQGVTDTVTQV